MGHWGRCVCFVFYIKDIPASLTKWNTCWILAWRGAARAMQVVPLPRVMFDSPIAARTGEKRIRKRATNLRYGRRISNARFSHCNPCYSVCASNHRNCKRPSSVFQFVFLSYRPTCMWFNLSINIIIFQFIYKYRMLYLYSKVYISRFRTYNNHMIKKT